MPVLRIRPEGQMLPVGRTFSDGEFTDELPPEYISVWDPVEPHESDRAWPGRVLGAPTVGLVSESSPEWPLEAGFCTARPETEPEELEELLVVVAVVVSEFGAGPLARVVRRGETGEPRSSSRKSGLLLMKLLLSTAEREESLNRLESESRDKSEMGFPVFDIFGSLTKMNLGHLVGQQ